MSFDEAIKETDRAIQRIIEENDLISDIVINAFMFTWKWWFGIGLFILPWILWLLFRKKESTGRLLIGGFVTIILSLVIDLIAITTGLWSYPVKFLPISPILFLPYHFSLVPVAIMFGLQIFPKANPLIKGVIYASIAAFVGMNFFDWIDFYNPKGWSKFYDFLIFLCLYMIAYWFSTLDSFKKIS